MLHAAPTSETKAETAQSKTQVVPQPEQELHPHLLSPVGLYSSGGMSGAASGTSPDAQRRQYLAGMQNTHGNQAVLRMLHGPQQVARMTPLRPSQGIMLQRKCACGDSSESTGECAECKAGREGAQQRSAGNQRTSAAANGVPPIVHDVLRFPGQSLDAGTRAFMEPRFGHDFSQVRVHTDTGAAESAKAVNALAYTVGRNVVFGTGQYAPGTSEGRRLITHELTHVVQQSGNLYSQTAPGAIADSQGSLEAEAEAQAQSIHLQPVSRAVVSGTVQRSGKTSKPEAGHCGGAYSCSNGDACTDTDNFGPFLPEKDEGAGTWQLKVYIDVDVATSKDIVNGDDVGHTYVEFIGSTGARRTYGFYPSPEMKPNEFQTTVFGCVVHPDTNHTSCVDYTETFNLTRAQYEKALKFAQDFCKSPEKYDLFNENCTTFAQFVARIAEQTLPGIHGPVAQGATNADNPNTLLENLQERDRKAIPIPAPAPGVFLPSPPPPGKQPGEE